MNIDTNKLKVRKKGGGKSVPRAPVFYMTLVMMVLRGLPFDFHGYVVGMIGESDLRKNDSKLGVNI
jgi:hypothetical protein